MGMPYDGAVLVRHQLDKKGYEPMSSGEKKSKHSRYNNQRSHCVRGRGVHSCHIFISRESDSNFRASLDTAAGLPTLLDVCGLQIASHAGGAACLACAIRRGKIDSHARVRICVQHNRLSYCKDVRAKHVTFGPNQ